MKTDTAPAATLAAFTAFVRHLPPELPDAILDAYAHTFAGGRPARRLAKLAQNIVDEAYDSGRIDVDEDADEDDPGVIVGVDGDVSLVAALPAEAVFVAMAILTYDLIDFPEFEEVTGWWAAAGGYLPTVATLPTDPPKHPAGQAIMPPPVERPAVLRTVKAETIEPDEYRPPVRTRRDAPPARPAREVPHRVATPPAAAPRQRATPATAPHRRPEPRIANKVTITLQLAPAAIVLLVLGAFGCLGHALYNLGVGTSPTLWWALLLLDVVAAVFMAAVRLHLRARVNPRRRRR